MCVWDVWDASLTAVMCVQINHVSAVMLDLLAPMIYVALSTIAPFYCVFWFMISPINVVSAFRSGTRLLIVGGFNMNFIKLSNYGLMYGQYYFK